MRSQCDSDTESRPGARRVEGEERVVGWSGERVASPEHRPERGSLSLHIATPSYSQSSPSSPVAKNPHADFLLSPSGQASSFYPGQIAPMKPLSAVSTKSTLSVHSASNASIVDHIFDIDFKHDPKEAEEEEDTSEETTIMANPKQDEELEDSAFPGNLGTIPELPELGYQSDSSDTELLLPR